jgi:hypothetical protein
MLTRPSCSAGPSVFWRDLRILKRKKPQVPRHKPPLALRYRMGRSLFRICAFGTYGGEKIGRLAMLRTLISCLVALAVSGIGVRLSSAFDQKTAYEQALDNYQC